MIEKFFIFIDFKIFSIYLSIFQFAGANPNLPDAVKDAFGSSDALAGDASMAQDNDDAMSIVPNVGDELFPDINLRNFLSIN